MTRGGRDKDRAKTERKCIVTGQVLPRSGLLRFVVGPDDTIVPDIRGKLPGRGIWVRAQRDALEKAATKGLFKRAAKTPVVVPEGLVASVEAALAARVIDLLSLARKAGAAVAGYEKVKGWLESGQAKVLIQACDGSGRGKGKLRPPAGNASFIGVLTAQELGLAFGRENVIHGALATGGLADLVVEEAARLTCLRETNGGTTAGKDTKD